MYDFTWRREWPFVLILAILGAGTRIAVALHPDAFVCGDTAIFGLMAKHIWMGQAAPLFGYGQAYNSSLATWVMAPFYGAMGADLRGVLLAHVALYALAVPVLFRLFFAVGGRWGAAAALLALGLGTRPLYDVGAMVGYFEMLPLAALLFLLVHRVAHGGASDRVGLAIGLTIGVGVYVNPQFVAPAFAALAALWAASPTRTMLRGPELATRVGVRLAWELRVAIMALALLFAGAVAAVLVGAGRWDVLGRSVSISHPERYVIRAGVILLAGWFALEVALNARRRAVFLGAVGVVVGQIPLLLYRLGDYDSRVHGVPLRFAGEHVLRNVRDAWVLTAGVLFGETGFPRGEIGNAAADLAATTWPWMVGASALAALIAIPALRAGWTLVRAAGRAFALVPTRVALPPMLALQAVVATVSALLHAELLQERYFEQLWLPYACALAAAVGTVARRSRAWAALALALIVVHHARDFAGVLEECRAVDVRTRYAELEGELVRRDATVGYAHYDEAYLASYLSDERVRLTSLGGMLARVAAYREAASRAQRPIAVFGKNDFGRDNRNALLERYPDLVVEAWESSHWWYVRMRRPRERGRYHLEELEGELRGGE